jgi:acyl-CoA synthetase (AMP-forming)/AMP-acid ligase II
VSGLLGPGARLVSGADDRVLTAAELSSGVAARTACLGSLPPGVLFLHPRLDVDSALAYLACWLARRPVALIDPNLAPDVVAALATVYRPAAVVGSTYLPGEGYVSVGPGIGWPGAQSFHVREGRDVALTHDDLGVLLATSGSTGSPKLVRLSWDAVEANARSIATALRIGPDEVAPTSLPFFYSYGLSVLNSHLVAGATLVISAGGILDRAFWTSFDRYGCTSLAGVPYHYSMLRRLRFDPADHPSLRTLTQAGGRLAPEVVAEFAERIATTGGQMFVMYGQTEATARIAVVPPDRLLDKLGSAGLPVPGGRLEIRDADASTGAGEVVYTGPNVMMGYAEVAEDLGRGDDLGGVLRTGDLGYLDDEGFLYLTGRSKRIGKVFGVRVSLDDIEHHLRDRGPVAALSGNDTVVVWLEGASPDERRAVARQLGETMHLHPSGFDVRTVDTLPLLGNGKIDYRMLEVSA